MTAVWLPAHNCHLFCWHPGDLPSAEHHTELWNGAGDCPCPQSDLDVELNQTCPCPCCLPCLPCLQLPCPETCPETLPLAELLRDRPRARAELSYSVFKETGCLPS